MRSSGHVLEIDGVSAGYGGADVIHDVHLSVREGTIHALIGVNGAGKTTLLRTISGVETARSGEIRFFGERIDRMTPAGRVRRGLAQVPENRRVFPKSSVEDNIRLGAVGGRRRRSEYERDLKRLLDHFPVLFERRRQLAGSLSGGEQQMLAIAMALISAPKVLLMDEPSLGLAPIIVERVFDEITRLRGEGTTILLVEQFARRALAIADDASVMQLGNIVAQGEAAALAKDASLIDAYLGGLE